MTTQEIIEVIKGLSVLELNDLVKACEEEFGVSAAAGVVVAAAGAGAAAAEEKTEFDVELTADDLKELAMQFKAEYKEKIGSDFPADPKEQLVGAIKAVFRSWDNPRANVYRRDNDIPYSWGTAVNVQMLSLIHI